MENTTSLDVKKQKLVSLPPDIAAKLASEPKRSQNGIVVAALRRWYDMELPPREVFPAEPLKGWY